MTSNLYFDVYCLGVISVRIAYYLFQLSASFANNSSTVSSSLGERKTVEGLFTPFTSAERYPDFKQMFTYFPFDCLGTGAFSYSVTHLVNSNARYIRSLNNIGW